MKNTIMFILIIFLQTRYKKEIREGKLKVEGTNDALTLALGIPEHRGRVRDIGAGVTHTSQFHTPILYTRPNQLVNQKDIDDLQKQWEERFQAQAQEFQAMMAKMKADYQNDASG